MTISRVSGRRARRADRLAIWPTTSIGTLAVASTVASIAFLALTFTGPRGGFPGLALGVAGGVLALIAILRRAERAVSVFAALVPLLTALAFLLAELVGSL